MMDARLDLWNVVAAAHQQRMPTYFHFKLTTARQDLDFRSF
jgi:hypothetical protein